MVKITFPCNSGARLICFAAFWRRQIDTHLGHQQIVFFHRRAKIPEADRQTYIFNCDDKMIKMYTIYKYKTYDTLNLRGKCKAESPVEWFNSSVVSVSFPSLAPIRTVPSGEAQLEWYRRFLWRFCDFFQLPPLKWTHVTSVSMPPQASSPVWEWSKRFLGRLGREHQGEPSLLSASTDLSGTPELFPPLTMIAAAKKNAKKIIIL